MGIMDATLEGPRRSTLAGTGADVLRPPAGVAIRELLRGGTVPRRRR